ncbi:SAM domain protein [Mollivirus kamchatka]|nr:SAM domain protein [Mollivirus kamchatka]
MQGNASLPRASPTTALMSDDIDEAFKTIRRFLGARRCQDCPYCQELHTTTPPGDPRVKRAIASTGLSHYAPAFAREEIDFDILPDIVDEDLVRMGITKIGARKRLGQLIAQIRSGTYHDTPPATIAQPSSNLAMFLKEVRESTDQTSSSTAATTPSAKETPSPSPCAPSFASDSAGGDDGSTDSAAESPTRLMPIKPEPHYDFDTNEQHRDRRNVIYPATPTRTKTETHRRSSSSSSRRKRTRSRSRSRSPKRRQPSRDTVRRRHCGDTTPTIASTICVQLKITSLEIENQEFGYGGFDYDQCSPPIDTLSNRLGIMFAKYGRLIDVYVLPRRGCAFANFVSADDAQAAMKGLTGHTGQGGVISPFGYSMVLLYGRKNLLEERPFEECSTCDSHRHSRD